MKKDIIVIENETKLYRVKKDEILSVSVNSGIVAFSLEDGSKIEKTMTLNKALELLPDFVKINRSCVVNSDKVKTVCKQTRTITLTNNQSYKVSFRNISKVFFTLN